MVKISYTEAYTSFLQYAARKEHKKLNEIVNEFRNDSTEKRFMSLYFGEDCKLSNTDIYKKLRRRKNGTKRHTEAT